MIIDTEKISNMSEAVIYVIGHYPKGHLFFGNQLHDDVARIYPPSTHQYPDTILRMARRHCRDCYRTVDRNRSLYEKVCDDFGIL
jgi:hypothetical protein